MGRKQQDDESLRVRRALEEAYVAAHPGAVIETYKRYPTSIRIRVVDPDFAGLDLVEREKEIWPILRTLPDEIRSNITMLVLVAPDDGPSLANLEFEDPSPSLL